MQKFNTFISRCLEKQNLDKQVVRYIIVGVASNTIGYLLYLVLTQLGVGHKTAMSGLYFIGVAINFYLNRSWTFRTTQSVRAGLARLLLAIALGYLLNLIWLYTFVDLVGWPHELVQLAAIVVISVYFFMINKHYVHAA
jgi:putative flippase GtrA